MESSKAAIALLLLLTVVAMAAGSAALLPASNNYTDDAAPALSNASWVEDAVGIFPAEAPAEMMLAAAANGVDREAVDRRVLAGGRRYIHPSVMPTMVRCFRPRCQGKGGSYTGRGDQCYYHNRACRK
uniref:Uncharacterized protein n=1 Tax=Leersia perrieri TaxID=77586 RepID=A0A0D9W455_9ORYZ